MFFVTTAPIDSMKMLCTPKRLGCWFEFFGRKKGIFVKSTTTKGPGYFYLAPSLPSSCFLGHVTGLFFCLYVKKIASSVYALFDC